MAFRRDEGSTAWSWVVVAAAAARPAAASLAYELEIMSLN